MRITWSVIIAICLLSFTSATFAQSNRAECSASVHVLPYLGFEIVEKPVEELSYESGEVTVFDAAIITIHSNSSWSVTFFHSADLDLYDLWIRPSTDSLGNPGKWIFINSHSPYIIKGGKGTHTIRWDFKIAPKSKDLPDLPLLHSIEPEFVVSLL